MRTIVIALLVGCGLGCASDRAADQPPSAQAQRDRDSAIGASNLPGAGGVRGALRAADSAAARQAQIDSVGRTP